MKAGTTFTKREASAPIEGASERLMESLPVEKNEPWFLVNNIRGKCLMAITINRV